MYVCVCVWRLLTPLFGGFENFGSVLLLLGKIKDFCRLRIARTHVPRNKWPLQISKQCPHLLTLLHAQTGGISLDSLQIILSKLHSLV